MLVGAAYIFYYSLKWLLLSLWLLNDFSDHLNYLDNCYNNDIIELDFVITCLRGVSYSIICLIVDFISMLMLLDSSRPCLGFRCLYELRTSCITALNDSYLLSLWLLNDISDGLKYFFPTWVVFKHLECQSQFYQESYQEQYASTAWFTCLMFSATRLYVWSYISPASCTSFELFCLRTELVHFFLLLYAKASTNSYVSESQKGISDG